MKQKNLTNRSASKLKYALLISTSIFLSGCADIIKLQNQYEENIENEYVKKAKENCIRYGITPDTDAFSQCIRADVNSEKDRKAIKDAASEKNKPI